MGAATGELGAKLTEKQHKVTISKGFYMRIHEVTQDQYLRVMGKNPSVFQGEMQLKNKRIVETMEPGVVGYNHPVDQVTWDDAVEFCKRLNEMPDASIGYLRRPNGNTPAVLEPQVHTAWETARTVSTKPVGMGTTLDQSRSILKRSFERQKGTSSSMRWD
jgi:formylglycine-generating enzyme required for sulfatase activity